MDSSGSNESRKFRRTWRERSNAERPGVSELHFPPVANGLDYLVSVVRHLAQEEEGAEHRDLKYGVLHLQAAAEVLLKARLEMEHWTLVIDKIAEKKVTREKYEDGDFNSINTAETARRLRDIVGLSISKDDDNALDRLGKVRNALQHYGLTKNWAEIEALAASVLDFLIRFVDDELLPELTDVEHENVADDLTTVREGLTKISGYVAARTSRLADKIKGAEAYTLECPACRQWFLTVDGTSSCHFCTRSWDPDDAALAYSEEILDYGWPDWSRGGGAPIDHCPDCEFETLVSRVRTAAAPDQEVYFCFTCATTFYDLEQCLRCGRLFQADEHETICGQCWHESTGTD